MSICTILKLLYTKYIECMPATCTTLLWQCSYIHIAQHNFEIVQIDKCITK